MSFNETVTEWEAFTDGQLDVAAQAVVRLAGYHRVRYGQNGIVGIRGEKVAGRVRREAKKAGSSVHINSDAGSILVTISDVGGSL